MKTYLVYHLNWSLARETDERLHFEITLNGNTSAVRQAVRDHLYEPVAMVTCDGLEQVFYLTNHIEHDWTKNEGVTLVEGVTRCRSTSVGDLIIEVYPSARSKRYAVASCGFDELEWSDAI